MPRKPKKPNTITMLVMTVPRLEELSPAEHRKAAREALGATGDPRDRRISVGGHAESTRAIAT
jgi:hypothetical protein